MNDHLRRLTDPIAVAFHVLRLGLINIDDSPHFVEVFQKIIGAHLNISNTGLRIRLMNVILDMLVANNPLSESTRFMSTVQDKLRELSRDKNYSARARHYSRILTR